MPRAKWGKIKIRRQQNESAYKDRAPAAALLKPNTTVNGSAAGKYLRALVAEIS